MMRITRKQFINHAVLPGLKPRLQDLFATGFNHIPFFLALVYQAVRLLPENHPYLNTQNMGKFGIRHVVAEAANNLVINTRNLDQIALFVTILFGLAIIFIQFGLLAFSLFAQPVMAAMPTSFAGFFVTPEATAKHDLAYIMLDLVFGVPGIFNSCVAAVTDCLLDTGAAGLDGADPWVTAGITGFPFPIHHGLHQMLQMYSTGLLIVATLITLYFMVTVVAETAQTGTAFGKRFNKMWAPLRLIVAFGLLIPVGYGLNSSQYIVLHAAKYGSGFATNGWNLFNDSLTGEYTGDNNSYLGKTSSLISRPNIPEIGGFLQFMFVARTCAEMYIGLEKGNIDIRPYLIKDPQASESYLLLDKPDRPFLDYATMIDFANGADSVTLRFGYRDPDPTENPDDPKYRGSTLQYKGGISPKCGELSIPLSDPRKPRSAGGKAEPAPEIIQRYYWFMIQDLWFTHFQEVEAASGGAYVGENLPRNYVRRHSPVDSDSNALLPDSTYAMSIQTLIKQNLDTVLDGSPDPGGIKSFIPEIADGAVQEQGKSETWSANDATLKQKGWAGAGIWYNKIAELNGTVSAAIQALPSVTLYPEVMEYVLTSKLQGDEKVASKDLYKPIESQNNLSPDTPDGQTIAAVLWESFDYWQNAGETNSRVTGNALVDGIQALFGIEGIYSMRKNQDVHPLAQLVGIGRSLIEASIRNLTFSIGGSVGGALGNAIDRHIGKGASVAIGLLMTIVITSLTVGFVLFYIVPFLPFIYFFFAVGGWIKGIFEAMVGAPLWALAHIRIDGNGLSGQAAINGYFLVFEIFLRPILVIFGFLASISIFSALVSVLNQTWDIVTANLGGFDKRYETTAGVDESLIDFMRSPIDDFFFTVVYAIIVYLMAMSSFKLIDIIPNNILRWMGQSIATFNDEREDPAAGLVGTASIGAQQSIRSVGDGFKGSLQGIASGGK